MLTLGPWLGLAEVLFDELPVEGFASASGDSSSSSTDESEVEEDELEERE